jgi:copper chaperone CopZ
MQKYTVKIDGMMCGMCEAHINDVIRKTVPDAKKVKSSHTKGIATFLAEDIDEAMLMQAIADTGYTALEVSSEEYKKRGLFF